MNILKSKNNELKNINQDMLNKLSKLEAQKQDMSAHSSLILKENSELKKELDKYKPIVEIHIQL